MDAIGPLLATSVSTPSRPGPGRRPGGLSAAAAISLVLALLGGLGGVAYVHLATSVSDSHPSVTLVALGLGLLVAAAVMVVGSLGMLGRRAWARVVLTVSVVTSAVLAALGTWPSGLPVLLVVDLLGGPVVVALAWTAASSRWLRPATG